MTNSNYPNRFLETVTIGGVPILQTHPGTVFWVNSSSVLPSGAARGGSNGNKGTYLSPFATVDYAISQCTASRGDIIVTMPGHTETISSASGLNLDVAGVAVVGLGRGSLRPTFNLTVTVASFIMSAANTSITNCLFTGGIDAVGSPITATADDCVIDSCEVRDVTGQVTDGILANSADRLKILNHTHNGATAAGTNSGVAIVGGDGIEITINRMDGNFAVGGINVLAAATTNLFVHDVNYFRTRNAADIFLVDTITASTGQVGPNINIRLQDNAANITEAVTGATFHVIDPVYVVNADDEKAILINWTPSTDA